MNTKLKVWVVAKTDGTFVERWVWCETEYRNRTMLPGSEYVVRNEMQESHDVAGSVVTKDVPTILRNSCRAWKIKFKNESKESMLHIWNMLCYSSAFFLALGYTRIIPKNISTNTTSSNPLMRVLVISSRSKMVKMITG